MPAPQRSIVPSVPGVPAWAAILVAAGATALGFLIDGIGGETYPTGTFSALYVLGCVLAVCAVRLRSLFSTMVMPPLLLFVAVPLACQMLGGRATASIKDVLMNLIIPLVERFPTMALATVLVLLIGGARIVIAKRVPAAAAPDRRTERKPVKRRRPEPAPDLATAARKRPRRATAVLDDPVTEVDMASPARRPARPEPKRAPAAARPREPRAGRAGAPRDGDPRPARPAAPRDAEPRGARAPREQEPARVPRRRGEAPPHPQPNVRYRDRADSARTERRRPDNG